MLNYIVRRLLIMIPTLAIISVMIFVIIQLPPGDIITSRLQELQAEGQDVSEEQIVALRARYNLNDPIHIQYFKLSKTQLNLSRVQVWLPRVLMTQRQLVFLSVYIIK